MTGAAVAVPVAIYLIVNRALHARSHTGSLLQILLFPAVAFLVLLAPGSSVQLAVGRSITCVIQSKGDTAMKKTIQSVLLACIALAILITGCAPAPIAVPPTFTPSPILPTFTPEPTATATQSQITIIEAPGNLESTQEIGCAQISDLKNTHTPADLYNGMVECMNQDNYSSAAFFFFLAGAYGYYDSLRVADTTAHDAISILIEQTVSSVDNTQKDAVGQELQNMTGNADKLLATCTEILRIGAPQYYPHYMIQHGMNAITGSNPDDDLVKNFDSVAAWKQTLDKYLHCPNPTP